MDAYVREFSEDKTHDAFYLNQSIVNIFLDYTTEIVKRYLNATSVLAWEIANDPRCNSSISASPVCNTTTVTSWHAQVAQHIASIDPNHIVAAGAHGFACQDCPKLFPIAPKPTTSAVPSKKKRNAKPVTNERLIREEKERRKKTREAKKRELLDGGDGVRSRGRWIAARQTDPGVSTSLGPSFDGSTGVDSQDILNIPNIGFGSLYVPFSISSIFFFSLTLITFIQPTLPRPERLLHELIWARPEPARIQQHRQCGHKLDPGPISARRSVSKISSFGKASRIASGLWRAF